MEPIFRRITVLGLGLLGGSMAKAVKVRGLAETVTGTVRDPARRASALELGIVDRCVGELEDAVAGADLVVVATPVRTIIPMLEKVFKAADQGCLVTDVGSTKYEIVKRAEQECPSGVSFIGGHPMAGSERSGFEYSDENLFENALCVLTPTACSNMGDFDRLTRFWESLKARVMTISPEEHDLLVGAASHLPHMAAVSLVNYAEGLSSRHDKLVHLLAGGFRDTTRIASSSPGMWRDICVSNRMTLVEIMKRHRAGLDQLIDLLERGDDDGLTDLFEQAKRFRDQTLGPGRGALAPVFEVIVPVTDRPGVIGEITGILGWEGINIMNIEIMTVREGEFGNLRILLDTREQMEKAMAALIRRGFAPHGRD